MPTAEQEVSGSDKMDTDGGDVVTQGSDTEDPKHPIDHVNGGRAAEVTAYALRSPHLDQDSRHNTPHSVLAGNS